MNNGTNPANLKAVASAAERVTLVIGTCAASRELYGTVEPVLEETPTLRRVALFYRGTGAYRLTAEERDAALLVIRGRFAVRYEA